MTLSETLKVIEVNYKKEEVFIKHFDYKSNKFIELLAPKFLFRGENNLYPTTLSNHQRLIHDSTLPIHEITHETLNLMQYLLNKFWGINYIDHPKYKVAKTETAAFMQHYGFPIMWVDFTSNIYTAAFFATYNNYTRKGRLAVLKLRDSVEKESYFYNLNKSFAYRPQVQNAWAIRMFDGDDLKKESNYYEIKWYDFEMDENDKQFANQTHLLRTTNDHIAKTIIGYIEHNHILNTEVEIYFEKIKFNLLN